MHSREASRKSMRMWNMRRKKTSLISWVIIFSVLHYTLTSTPINLQEDEAVLYERKMKAEEEEVDIDTLVSGAQAAAAAFGGPGPGGGSGTFPSVGTGTGGAATPIKPLGNGHTPSSSGSAVDGAIGKLGLVGTGELGAVVDMDADSAWAHEEPDGDEPGEWKMKVRMDDESAEYY